MKTEYTTQEDKEYLSKMIGRAATSTDNLIFTCPENIKESISRYRKFLIEFRAKCFEFLEEEDPNQVVINIIKKELNRLDDSQDP